VNPDAAADFLGVLLKRLREDVGEVLDAVEAQLVETSGEL
jgi:hypothetical protein